MPHHLAWGPSQRPDRFHVDSVGGFSGLATVGFIFGVAEKFSFVRREGEPCLSGVSGAGLDEARVAGDSRSEGRLYVGMALWI